MSEGTELTIKLTPRLCRAARSLVGWRQEDLAHQSEVPLPTISAFEAKEEVGKLATMNNRALVETFEKAGLEFIPENGGGAGVRLAKSPKANPRIAEAFENTKPKPTRRKKAKR